MLPDRNATPCVTVVVVATDFLAIVCGLLCAMRGREGEAPAEPALDEEVSYPIAARLESRPPLLSAKLV